MEELRPGLWTWAARHPGWQEERDLYWGPEVRSYALIRGDHVILFDPISPPVELLAGRAGEIVLTAEWHKRSSAELGLPVHEAGDPLPDGIEERPAFYLPEERFLWLPQERALVAGDSLPDGGEVPDAWLDVPRQEYRERLRPLLELPIELLLPTHGDPIVADAHARLERALS